MKNYKLLKCLFLILCSVAFIQCTSDPVIGPAGANGSDGTDGIDGVDGADGATGTATCVACHSESHRDPIESSFLMSKHATESVMYDGSLVSTYTDRGSADSEGVKKDIASQCAICHTNEGYIEYVSTGAIQNEPYGNTTGVSCTTCHEKHGTFDFENDGHDFALRSFEIVELRSVPGATISYLNEDGTPATSNNCVTCHQPRSIAKIDDDADGKIVVPNRYGPHYGAQTTLLEGISGVEISGSTVYPSSNAHREGASCVSCHMGAESGDTGAHTFVPTLNACTSCHGDTAESKVTNFQAEIDGLMTELETLFTAEGLLTAEGGLNHSVPYDIVVADAYWNYKFVYYDHSHGVHNPEYTKALLKNSIEALEARQ